MTTVRISETAGFAEFRKAEQAVWAHYGIEPREELVNLGDGRVVRVHEVGEGDPVLFIHGTGGSGVYFAPLLQEISARFRCIVVDRPGWTLSTPIDYSADHFDNVIVAWLEDLLAALNITRTHIVGGSIGNLYGLRLALVRPQQVGNIVLLAGLPAEGLTPPRFLRILRTPIGKIIVKVPQKPQMIRKQLAGLGHQHTLSQNAIPAEFIDLKVAESRHTDALKNERQLVQNVVAGKGFQPRTTLTSSELAAISSPTLMVYGTDDPVGSKSLWRDFTAAMPDATLHIAGSGHLPWFDDPTAVNRLTNAHLQRTPQAST